MLNIDSLITYFLFITSRPANIIEPKINDADITLKSSEIGLITTIIPILGEYIANDRKSYQYLVESINKFPKQGDFLKMIEKAGFKRVGYKNLSLGITALHYGYRS